MLFAAHFHSSDVCAMQSMVCHGSVVAVHTIKQSLTTGGVSHLKKYGRRCLKCACGGVGGGEEGYVFQTQVPEGWTGVKGYFFSHGRPCRLSVFVE